MPAPEAQTPTSQSAARSACSKRTAYGAPEAPVMPRKTRTRTTCLLPALRGREEDADVADVLRAAEVAELRHDRVAELARVADVPREELSALSARSDRAQVGGALVRRPRAEIRVAGRAARLREELRACDGLRVVR